MIRRAAGAVVLHGDACLLVHKVKVMDGPGGLLSHQESRDFFERVVLGSRGRSGQRGKGSEVQHGQPAPRRYRRGANARAPVVPAGTLRYVTGESGEP